VIRCQVCGRENLDTNKFCGECAAPLVEAERPFEVRKIVTIVFCDVTGSTSMGEALDPESVRHVMERYFVAMQTAIHHHEGTVEKFIGDAVMAVFGVPQVHEDDALRAVRAAAEMREALAALNEELDRDHGMTLACRIGVNTGEVVAGAGDQKIVTGDAVNVAARLEQAAPPGEILLGEDTVALVRDAVIAELIDPLDLKGKTDPVSAFRLLEVTPGAAGFARHLDAPMVGRARELSLLRSAFERTVTDHACQLFTVLGVAGVGKSRLMAAFGEGLGERARVLRGRCLPYGDGITFYPLAEALIDVADLNEADTPHAARAKLAALVGRGEHAETIAERVGQAIGIPGSQSAPEETLWAIRVLLERLAAERPVVFMIDDLQWAEPRFLELVEHVADLAQDAPILLACMARPELLNDHPGWAGGKLNATSMLLEPLAPEECGTLVANLLADDSVDEAVRTSIAEAAEGHPLYAEEITGLLVDEGRLVLREGRWVATGDISDVPVPPTIAALLAARLDRLSSQERRLIDIASVMGQVFYSGAVRELAEDAADRVDSGITALVRKQFVRSERSDIPATEALAFRHLLIRDAAYDAISKTTRAELHEGFADWLDGTAGALGERDEILGYHLEQAYRYRTELGPLDDRAMELGRRAGERLGDAGLQAFDRDDMSASAALLDRAVRVLPSHHPRLPALEDRLVTSFFRSEHLERAAEANARHIQDARSLGDRAQEQRAELGALELRVSRSPQDVTGAEVHGIAQRAIEVFEELGDEEGLSNAHMFLLESAMQGGGATEALTHAELSLDHALRSEASVLLMDVPWHIEWALSAGPTPAGAALARLEWLADQMAGYRSAEASAASSVAECLAFLGRFEEARATARHAMATFEELDNRIGVVMATSTLSRIEWFAGDPPAAEGGYRAWCGFSRDLGNHWILVNAVLDLAELLVVLGRDDEVLEQTNEIQSLIAPDEFWTQARWRAVRAIAHARLGHLDEALILIEEAERRARRSSEFLALIADTMRSKAEVLKIANRRDDAVVAAREALALYETKEFIPHIGWTRALLDTLTA
jgi:class 3 adenylate cyclase/tetratricopeptide (TPR) repeat protein